MFGRNHNNRISAKKNLVYLLKALQAQTFRDKFLKLTRSGDTTVIFRIIIVTGAKQRLGTYNCDAIMELQILNVTIMHP